MRPRSGQVPHAFLVALAACLSPGCSSDGPPDADPFDGNALFGDATSKDASPRDIETADTDDPVDGDSPDTADGGGAETGARDALDGDSGELDGGMGCQGVPVATLTATQAVAQAAALDGQVVDVTGTATVTAPTCTAQACPPEMPCCNTCTGEVQIEGLVTLEPSVCYPRTGCRGDECAQVCAPPVLGLAQTYRGVLREGSRGPILELERVLP